MGVLAFVFVGLVAGWLAGQIVQGRGLGTLGDIMVGIVGALVGGLVYSLLGIHSYGFWGAVVMATVGSIVFLFVVGLLTSNRRIAH